MREKSGQAWLLKYKLKPNLHELIVYVEFINMKAFFGKPLKQILYQATKLVSEKNREK